jgi:hypothetical protein
VAMRSDSKVVVGQVLHEYEAMKRYLAKPRN